MKVSHYILSLLLAVLSCHALGDELQGDNQNECQAFTGSQEKLPEADLQYLKSAVAIFKNKDRKGLLAMSEKNLLLVRRLAFSVDARGGQLRVEIKPSQIDNQLNIHIGKMTLPSYLGRGEVHHGPQLLKEFSTMSPTVGGSAIVMGRKVCDGFQMCDIVPDFNLIEKLIEGLLSCEGYKNTVFVFSDGILLVNMQNVEAAGIPLGEALFFSKTLSGYKLAVLISFQ
jgi:hypothetical protein